MHGVARRNLALLVFLPLLWLAGAGCGSTKSRLATDQLLMSDAVDRTVSEMDFRLLSEKKVYFDTKYVQPIKGYVFVNAEYVISSLRQQMVAAGCLLQDKQDDADFIVEARVGALGTDGHEVTYGIPANSAVSEAATMLPAAPRVPMIPEIALAKKNDSRGAAKIAVFAYHRQTREPVWQSGIAVATSTAKEAWIFGAGPIRYGTIYDNNWINGKSPKTQMAYSRTNVPEGRMASYYGEREFRSPDRMKELSVARRTSPTDGPAGKPANPAAPAAGAPAPAAAPPSGASAPGGTGRAPASSPSSSPPSGPAPAPNPAAPVRLPNPAPPAAPLIPPDAYPFLPAQPPDLPHLLPLTSDQFPAPPSQGILLLDPLPITSDLLPRPPSEGMILTDLQQITSDRYPAPGPQTLAPPAPPPLPASLPFVLQ